MSTKRRIKTAERPGLAPESFLLSMQEVGVLIFYGQQLIHSGIPHRSSEGVNTENEVWIFPADAKEMLYGVLV